MQEAYELADRNDSEGYNAIKVMCGDVQRMLPPQPAQEPVLVVEKEPDYMSRGHFYTGTKPHIDPTKIWSLPIGTKLYTTPPQRPWVGLTDEEIKCIEETTTCSGNESWLRNLTRSLEAKLKEKANDN